MANEQQKVQFIDSTYMLEDMIIQFDDSNHQAKKVINQHEETLKQLKKIKAPTDAIKAIISKAEEEIKQIKEVIRVNDYRANCLKPVLLMVQHTKLGQDENVRFIISMMLEAMGVVNRDCKPFAERTELKPEPQKEEVKA